jgi:hypothetical protein
VQNGFPLPVSQGRYFFPLQDSSSDAWHVISAGDGPLACDIRAIVTT